MKNLKIVLTIIFITFLAICAVYVFVLHKKNTILNTKQEVVFWSLQMGSFDEYMNPLISKFEKQNPDLKIKWIDVPYSEGEKRTLASILSNTPPDLVNLTPDFSAVLAQKQALMFFDCAKLSQYNKQIVEILKYDEKCYAIPFYATSAITMYNKDIFESAQITKLPKTYDDMFKIAAQVKQYTNHFVTMPTLTENDTFLKILNKYDIDTSDKLTSKTSEEIFQKFKTLYEKDFIPKESITQNHQEALEKYMSGQLAFIQSGGNFLNIVKENAPQVFEKTGVSNQLTGCNGKYDVSIMNLIIPARAKNRDGALRFALFLTNKQNQIDFAKLTTILPVNNEALRDDYFISYEENDVISKARVISASQLSNLQSPVKFDRNQKEILMLLNTAVQKIVLDKVTLQECLSETKKLWKLME